MMTGAVRKIKPSADIFVMLDGGHPRGRPGSTAANDHRGPVVSSISSPAKFPDTIRAAIGIEPTDPSLEVLKAKPVVKHRIKATPDAIRAFIDRHAVG